MSVWCGSICHHGLSHWPGWWPSHSRHSIGLDLVPHGKSFIVPSIKRIPLKWWPVHSSWGQSVDVCMQPWNLSLSVGFVRLGVIGGDEQWNGYDVGWLCHSGMVSVLHKLPDGPLIGRWTSRYWNSCHTSTAIWGWFRCTHWSYLVWQCPGAPVWHSGWSGWPTMVTRVANHVLPHPLASFQFVPNGGPPIYGCLLPGSPRDLCVIPHH
jgi:hypothetical protein